MAEQSPTTSPPARELEAAVVHLYEVFAHRRKDARGWTDMEFPDDRADLPERGDVRTLDGWEYDHIAWHAFCFDGNHPPTVKYFLPRLLDEWDKAPFELEMLVSYMHACQWRQWPEREVHAIERFCAARFRMELCSPYREEQGHRVTEVLRLTAFMGIALDPFFAIWQADLSLNATRHLARLVCELVNGHWSFERVLSGWSNLWGDEGVSQSTMRGIVAQILALWVSARLEAAFFDASAAQDQQRFSDSLVYIDTLRAMMEVASPMR